MPRFGALLKELLQGSQVGSQRALAREAGLSREAVRLYITGARLPTNDNFLRLTKALDISGLSEEQRLLVALAYDRGQGGEDPNTEALICKLQVSTSEVQIRRLLEVFFDWGNRPRTPELEHVLRQEIARALTEPTEEQPQQRKPRKTVQ